MKTGRAYIVSILLLLLSIFALSVFSNGADSKIEVVCKEYAYTGEEFSVKINITTPIPSKGAQCDITFNPDVLHVLNVSNGGMFDLWMNDLSPNFTKWDNENGTITNIVAFSFSSTTTAGTFAVIKFQAVGEGMSYINITNVIISDANGSKINATIKNATVTVDDTPPQTSINIGGIEENNVFIENVTINLTAKDTGSGVLHTYYKIDDGSWKVYLEPFYFEENGEHTIYFYSVDKAGNKENNKTKSFIIEKNAPPVANFSYSPTNPTDLDTISFTDLSQDDRNIVSWQWQFGDGNMSTQQNPSHRYADNGVYTVTLTVEDDDGATDSMSKQIVVSNVPPVSNFSYSPSAPEEEEQIHFHSNSYDSDGNVINYTWNFGDGSIGYGKNVSHVYSKAGNYNVTLTVKDNDGASNSISKTININKLPPVKYTLVTSVIPENAGYVTPAQGTYDEGAIITITAHANSGFEFDHWSDGTGKPTIQIIMDENKSIIAYFVEIRNNINFSINYAPKKVHVGEVVNFYAYSYNELTYTWNFGDGSIGYGKNVSHVYSKAGSYEIICTGKSGENVLIKRTTINVIDSNLSISISISNPSPGITINLSANCDFGTNYTWNFGDGSIGYGKNASHVYSNEGIYNVICIATDRDFEKRVERKINVSLPDFYASVLDKERKGKKVNYSIVVGNNGGYVPEVKISFYRNGKIILSRNITFLEGEQIEIIREEFDRDKKIKVVVNSEGIEEENTENNILYLSYISLKKDDSMFYILPVIAAVAAAVAFYIYRLKKKKIRIKGEKKELRCEICFGKFKPGAEIVKCECGAVFHKSCAKRVGVCPICGRELSI